MSYRPYGPCEPTLFGYDPARDVSKGHLCRLIDDVVESCVRPESGGSGVGQPQFDPRLLVKVLVYAYSTGVRSSRRMEQLCKECLPYLFLTRGDAPSYRTLCTARVEMSETLEAVWTGLFAVSAAAGIKRIGHLTVDSTKLWADASPESVLRAAEFAPVLDELKRILAEAQEVDDRETREDLASVTELQQPIDSERMRDILRRVRKQQARARHAKQAAATDPCSTPEAGVLPEMEQPTVPAEATVVEESTDSANGPSPRCAYSSRMLKRVATTVEAIESAQEEGEKHLCVTDPDAKMMHGGRVRSNRESHSLEVVVDNGMLVAAQSTQEYTDHARLEPLIDKVLNNEPDCVKSVTADSGYYSGDAVGRLLARGFDLCVPDSNVASVLNGRKSTISSAIPPADETRFKYDEQTDCYICQAGERLHFQQERKERGQVLRIYATKFDCQACPLKAGCLVNRNARHRTIRIGRYHEALKADRERFRDPAHRQRYRHRSDRVETVFGFLRGTLGYNRWSLRGKRGAQCETKLFSLAYQLRKIHSAILTPCSQAAV